MTSLPHRRRLDKIILLCQLRFTWPYAATNRGASMPGPLHGLRVLELARILAGPWAGQILADLGKRSSDLDFERHYGRRIVRKLAARSDVLIENFKVGGLAKFGLDYKSLAPDNPRLIYCSVTGFGQTGPYAQRPGYDLMAQGMAGMMDLTGNPDGEPMRAGVPVSDIFTGVYSAVGILAALARREKTGQGGYVDTALVDTTVGVLSNQALNYFVSGKVPHRMGNAHPNITPYQVFPVADGHIIIASGNDGQFGKLCAVLGEPDLAKQEKYIDNKSRLAHRAELIGHLCGLTARLPRQALLEKLEAVGGPAGPINDLGEVVSDPQVVARGMKIERPSAAAADGKIPGVRTPITLDGAPLAAEQPSPRLGEHTQEILREIGEA